MSAEIERRSEVMAPPHFDLVVVMGAPMTRGPDGSFYYADFSRWKDGLSVVGDIRARAMSHMSTTGMTPHIAVTGGYEEGTDHAVSRAQELIKHTHNMYAVPNEHMITLTSPRSSQGNINEAAIYLEEFVPELLVTKNIAFLSNTFHLSRTDVFVNTNPFFQRFQQEGGRVALLSAEELTIEAGLLTEQEVAAYYNSPEILAQIVSEQQGVIAFQDGTYQYRNE